MYLLAQSALGADAVQTTDEQHAHHQLGIDRWPPNGTVVWRESPPDEAEVEHRIHAPKQMIGRHVIIAPETKNSGSCPDSLPIIVTFSHSAIPGTNHATNPPASEFFNSLDP